MIQDILKRLDPKEIENYYFQTFPINITDLKNHDNLTIREYRRMISEQFQSFLSKLCNMQIKHDGKNDYILFVHKAYDEELDFHKTVSCVSKNEVKKLPTNEVSSYAYEFTETKEALSFLVADTQLTHQNIMDVIVSFLDEISFFGYNQEHLEENKQQLEESIREMDTMKENPDKYKSYTVGELEGYLGLPKEEKYPEEKIKERLIQRSIIDYNMYCKTIELNKIKDQLNEEDKS